jgi:flagellar FliL protein
MVDAADAETPPPPRSGPSLLMIILAAVIAAALAGGGVYFMTAKKDDQGVEEKAEAAGKQDKKPKLPALYVKLDPPFVSNFENRGSMRFLQVSVEVMTRDAATVDLIKQHDPMIRNDLLMLLSGQTYETISTHEGKEQLRSAALEAVRKVIAGEGGDAKKVEQLYFTSFVMQ